jgi:hypothetical protein
LEYSSRKKSRTLFERQFLPFCNCRRIILQNFYVTLIVDTIGIGLAAARLLNPLLATFIHVASELIFILNSTRLLPPRGKGKGSSPNHILAHT